LNVPSYEKAIRKIPRSLFALKVGFHGTVALGTLSWYTSESSAYVIQGVSATVRGQSKLYGEGEPQGVNRQAPEPPDTPYGTWGRQVSTDEGRDGVRRRLADVYISAPLQLIRVMED